MRSRLPVSLGVICLLGSAFAQNPIPDLINYQFNELRGTQVNNVATSGLVPAKGTVATADWQADPGRIHFNANPPGIQGFGCLAVDDVAPYDNHVDTGWPTAINGSHTIMWWQRLVTIPADFCYPFGLGDGAVTTNRPYYSTYSGKLFLWEWGPISLFGTTTDLRNHVGVWMHMAVVIDDANKTAEWFVDGVSDGTTTYTGTMSIVDGSSFVVGRRDSVYPDKAYTRYFEMDDFRLYGSALTTTDIAAAQRYEVASDSYFDTSCGSPAPVISTTGRPFINSPFQNVYSVNLSSAPPVTPLLHLICWIDAVQYLGIPFPMPLGPAGCYLNIYPDMTGISQTDASGDFSTTIAIPADIALAGAHLYHQFIVLDSQLNILSTTETLDSNIQKR